MSRELRRRLARIEANKPPPAWYPDGPMTSWTNDELWAVLEHYDPTLRERIENMTDAELIAELQRIASS